MNEEKDLSIEFYPRVLEFGDLKENIVYFQTLAITLSNIDLYDLRAYSKKPRAYLHVNLPKIFHILSIESLDLHKYIIRVAVCENIPDDWKKEKLKHDLFEDQEKEVEKELEKYQKIEINESIELVLNDSKKFSIPSKGTIYDSQLYHAKELNHSISTKIFSSKGLNYLKEVSKDQQNYHISDHQMLLIFPTKSNLDYFENKKVEEFSKEQEENNEKNNNKKFKKKKKTYDERRMEKIRYLEERRKKYEPRTIDILKLSLYELMLNKIHLYNYLNILLDRTRKINKNLNYLKSINENCIQQSGELVLEKKEGMIPYVYSGSNNNNNNNEVINSWNSRLGGLVELGEAFKDSEKRRNYYNLRYLSSSVGSSVGSFLTPLGFEEEDETLFPGTVLKNSCFSGTVCYFSNNTGVFTRTIYDILLLGWKKKEFGENIFKKNEDINKNKKIEMKNICFLEGFFIQDIDQEILRIYNLTIEKIKKFFDINENNNKKEMKGIDYKFYEKKYELLIKNNNNNNKINSEEIEETNNSKEDNEIKLIFDEFFETNKDLDGFIIPTTKASEMKFSGKENFLISNGIEFNNGKKIQTENSMILSCSGYKCFNIPIGFNSFNNIPVGISVVGKDEKSLFNIIRKLGLIF